jgi:hypothetical protein
LNTHIRSPACALVDSLLDHQRCTLWGAGNRCFDHTGASVGANKLRPLRFELLERIALVTGAPAKALDDSLSKRHSFAISNLGGVSEMATGESVVRVTIGK